MSINKLLSQAQRVLTKKSPQVLIPIAELLLQPGRHRGLLMSGGVENRIAKSLFVDRHQHLCWDICISQTLPRLIHVASLGGKYHYCPHITAEDTEVQRY